MIVSIDDVVVKEVQLTKDKTTLGRRPYNDIVIESLAVSGEHAVLHMDATAVVLEDLNSTNGTFINGKAIKKQTLQHGDGIEVGKYKIRYMAEGAGPLPQDDPPAASIMVLSGVAAGREVALTKAVTTVGKPGVVVAAITKQPHGYAVYYVEGADDPLLNGQAITSDPLPLKDGDVIELAGNQMRFLQP